MPSPDSPPEKDSCTEKLELLRQLLTTRTPPELPQQFAEDGSFALLYNDLLALRQFVMAVAAGNLSSNLPMKGYTAGALKTLQANLRHMTWQTQMIADGDFSQRLDFLGDFSISFNAMTEQLAASIRTIHEKDEELQRINTGLEREIEARKQTEHLLAEREAHYRTLTETMKDVVWVLNASTLRFSYVSPSVTRLLGYTQEELTGLALETMLEPETASQLLSAIIKHRANFLNGSVPQNTFYTSEVEFTCKNGKKIWIENIVRYIYNEKTGVLDIHGTARDVSERRALQKELERQATIDELTGVFNRRHFLGTLEKEIQRFQRHASPLSLLMIDVDHFKCINDTYGHLSGDNALRILSKTLQTGIRSTDSLGRIGGEEFAILLINNTLPQSLNVGEALRRRIESVSAHAENGENFPITISIGAAEYLPSDTMTTLMARADQGLYQAKAKGRNRVEYVTENKETKQ